MSFELIFRLEIRKDVEPYPNYEVVGTWDQATIHYPDRGTPNVSATVEGVAVAELGIYDDYPVRMYPERIEIRGFLGDEYHTWVLTKSP